MRSRIAFASMVMASALAGCGGGGGDAAPQVFSFPPPTAASFANPGVFQYFIAGDCSGSEVHLRAAAATATFSGQSVTGVTTTRDRILLNCAAAGSTSSRQTIYYDANFADLGADNSSGAVAVQDRPLAVPATLKVGDGGTYGTETVYSDSTRTKVLSRAVYTYAVQPETRTTALLVFTTTVSDAGGTLQLTEKTVDQLRSDGSYAFVSQDFQYATPSPLHLVYVRGTSAVTLSAGTTVTLTGGQLLLVPAGTTVTLNGGTSALQGHLGTLSASSGATVSVPTNASGPADNIVMAR